MELLQQHGLSLKLEKCEFEKTSVEYLGVVRGRSYELSTWYSMLIPYLDLTLSYSPIAPPMLAYLCLVLILMFYDVLRYSIVLFVYVNSYHHHR